MRAPLAVVIGLGRSGLAVAGVLDAEGHRVRVVDRTDTGAVRERAGRLPAGVELLLGGYGEDVGAGAALVCPSPGVPWDAPELRWARAHGIPVRSEIDLVFERCPAPIVGVTGTNGKTTTTALCGALIAAGGARVHVGGNIGETMLDRLADVAPQDWVVLELSSFQLESAAAPRCRLAAVLNISPDHLDRHGTMGAYVAAKRRIVEFADPRGAVVLNADDPAVLEMAARAEAPVLRFAVDAEVGRGTVVRDGVVTALDEDGAHAVLPVNQIPLLGAHNVSNVLCAVTLARAAGVAIDAIAGAVGEFRPVRHRLEPVLDAGGVLWVDDSKATNVGSALTGLRAFAGRPLVWIGGGASKGVGPGALADAVVLSARHAVLNGASAAELDAALAERGYASRTAVRTLAEAVEAARRIARSGDVVLLSPGYTSYDQFADFEERGDAFRAMVLGDRAGTAPVGR